MRHALVVALALSLASCKPKPRPAPPPAPPAPAPVAPPASTATLVKGGQVVFEAPQSWQRYDASGTEFADTGFGGPGAVMLMTSIPMGDRLAERRREAATSLARAVSVTPKAAVRLDGPAQARPVPIGTLELWEEPASRKGKEGSLLVFSGQLDAQWLIVGVGYAVANDRVSTQQILDALQTIRRP
jgi:hypothetical protein